MSYRVTIYTKSADAPLIIPDLATDHEAFMVVAMHAAKEPEIGFSIHRNADGAAFLYAMGGRRVLISFTGAFPPPVQFCMGCRHLAIVPLNDAQREQLTEGGDPIGHTHVCHPAYGGCGLGYTQDADDQNVS